jgi:hypothetical protein
MTDANTAALTLLIGELHIDLDEANKTIAAFAAERDKLQERIETLEACNDADRNTAKRAYNELHVEHEQLRTAAETSFTDGQKMLVVIQAAWEAVRQATETSSTEGVFDGYNNLKEALKALEKKP